MTASAGKPHDRAPVMNFIDNRLDRLANLRGDTDWIKGQLSRSDTEIVLSTANRLVLPAGSPSQIGLPLGRAVELGADLEEMIFLGLDGEGTRPYFAATLPGSDEEMEAIDGVRVIDLRTLALEAELHMCQRQLEEYRSAVQGRDQAWSQHHSLEQAVLERDQRAALGLVLAVARRGHDDLVAMVEELHTKTQVFPASRQRKLAGLRVVDFEPHPRRLGQICTIQLHAQPVAS